MASASTSRSFIGPQEALKHSGPSPKKHPLKRRKLKSVPSQNPLLPSRPEESQSPSRLTRIPLEILAEVLLYVPSTRDILALARCSKYFCGTLVNNPGTVFIWKRVRAGALPSPIPDPTPNFTEAAYAAYLFDGGRCEACNAHTTNMYVSFAIRLRLCRKPTCKMKWITSHAQCVDLAPSRYVLFKKWLLRPESDILTDHVGSFYFMDRPYIYRKSDWDAAVDEFNKAMLTATTSEAYLLEKEKMSPRLDTILEHANAVSEWKKAREEAIHDIRDENEALVKKIADREGWVVSELKKVECFISLVHAKNHSLEHITDPDIEAIRPQVETQILSVRERHEHREAEKGRKKRQEDVEKHYDRLRTANPKGVLPTLHEFRKLPIMQVMQGNSSAGDGVSRELKHVAIEKLLKAELGQWEHSTRERLGDTLGYPKWKSASTKKLNPTQRWTARFRCQRCDAANPRGCWDDRGFSFVGVCGHMCKPTNRRERSKGVWSTELFVPDQQAIGAVTQILEQLGVDPEDAVSLQMVKGLGIKVQCLSCTVPILMTFPMMLSHCRRHEKNQFTVLSNEEASQLSSDLVRVGTRALVMQATPTGSALRKEKIYSCRYCVLANRQKDQPSAQAEAASSSDTQISEEEHKIVDQNTGLELPSDEKNPANKGKGIETKPGGGAKGSKLVFTFDGLRSHVKEKHGIVWIGDEDIICSDLTTFKGI